MSRSVVCVVIVSCCAAIALASPCRDNSWQPTYVHDLVNNDGRPYYVMPDGSFVELTGDWANQSGPGMCCLYGVRDQRGFTSCFEYTRVQCGCDLQSMSNDTCRRFLAQRGSAGPPAPQGGPFTGAWSCPGRGTLTLDQQQSNVTGTFTWNGGGTVTGTTTGNRVDLNARENRGVTSVWAMTMSADGRRISGTWSWSDGRFGGNWECSR